MNAPGSTDAKTPSLDGCVFMPEAVYRQFCRWRLDLAYRQTPAGKWRLIRPDIAPNADRA